MEARRDELVAHGTPVQAAIRIATLEFAANGVSISSEPSILASPKTPPPALKPTDMDKRDPTSMGDFLPDPTSLPDDHPIKGLTEAISHYAGKPPPFALKGKGARSLPFKDVFLTRNGQRSPQLIRAKIFARSYDDHHYFRTLDLNGDRLIVKGWPNAGVLSKAKWIYRAWSSTLNDFEELPVAFTTINNDPENLSSFAKESRQAKAEKTVLDNLKKGFTNAQTPTTHKKSVPDDFDEGVTDAQTPNTNEPTTNLASTTILDADLANESCGSDNEYASENEPKYTIEAHRTRSNPIPGSFLDLDIGQSALGSHTSDESASLTTATSNSSSSSDEAYTPISSGPQQIQFTPVNRLSSSHLGGSVHSQQEPLNQSPSSKRIAMEERQVDVGGNESHDQSSANVTTAAHVYDNQRHVPSQEDPPHLTNSKATPRNHSRTNTYEDKVPPKEREARPSQGLDKDVAADNPASTPLVDLPLSLARPRRNLKPTEKMSTDVPPNSLMTPGESSTGSVVAKRKPGQNASDPKAKKQRKAKTSSTGPAAHYETPSITPKPPGSDAVIKPSSCPEVYNLTISTHKQANTTLRVALASSDFVGVVLLKLRSCLTIDSFFTSILSASDNLSRETTASAVSVAFDWKEEGDPRKRICVKKGIPDSFESFVETIDEAPCWNEEKSKCEVAVAVLTP